MYYSAAVAARSLGIPIVLTLHDHGLVCVKRSFMYGSTTCSGPRPMKCVACARVEYGVAKAATLKTGHMVSAPLLRAAAMLLPVSSAVRDIAIRASRLPAEKFMVLPAPLPDFVGDAELSAPQFLADVPPFILYVGALSRHKGVDVLLDAYAQLSDPPPLVLLGTPQPNQGLRFPAGVLVHENVDYLDVLASYDRALCTVVPSVWDEPLSSVPREALLRRCAIVVSDGGALPEIAGHGEAGLVAARGDASALAEAIASMVAKPELRRQLALRGRDRAERYFASRIAEELEAVYEVVRADAARQRR
jgi:glycosyltransferase involved in cell wall biosynthesis